LSQYDSEEMIYKATEAGARGYVLKTDARNVGAAVEAVCQHKPFFTPKLPRTRRPNLSKLRGRRTSALRQWSDCRMQLLAQSNRFPREFSANPSARREISRPKPKTK